MKTPFLFALGLIVPGTALAADPVALTSMVFVEKTSATGQGRNRIVLEPPGRMASGDRLVFMLNYRSAGARSVGDFVVTNPMPAAVAYQGTSDPGAVVSIDGGRNWGPLARLKVTERDGTVRSARPEDVTHVRWTLNPAAGPAGRLMFRGVVR
ncbi:hypothetical protein [Sphingomonas colocasiae]|uniref:DUF11 domain-containing protein n=1 Tax=Sphingomonas colocasiae TaxID=1848973 RepID=A0ABS7PP83_9SPHN|nr:hypothetical protein [Sphingomonas colocasiae]MBY8823130.1 hypothetical protein [Sphingomonas colocasiae]